MAKNVLIKPIVSEKAEKMSNTLQQYSFVVARGVNKIEIRKAVEALYGVSVVAVNTSVMPGKNKVRTTKTGMLRGRVPAYKKAIVTLAQGEEIDFFGEI